jgi:hypothetical protein
MEPETLMVKTPLSKSGERPVRARPIPLRVMRVDFVCPPHVRLEANLGSAGARFCLPPPDDKLAANTLAFDRRSAGARQVF